MLRDDSHPPFSTRQSCDIDESTAKRSLAFLYRAAQKIHPPAIVENALLCATLGRLLLLLLVDLWGLGLYFACTGERAVD
jgi:hypothetical protein